MIGPSHRSYGNSSDLCVIATYFNPANYTTKRDNFFRFLEPLSRGGVTTVVAEGLIDRRNRLPDDLPCTLVRVPCTEALWQKERLLNLALAQVPDSFPFLAWLDCDLLFAGPDWIPRSVAALRAGVGFLQPFDVAIELPRYDRLSGELWVRRAFGSLVGGDHEIARQGHRAHGHAGFAWVTHTELVRSTGFYDRCVTGCGDHLMAHAMTATADSACVADDLGPDSPAHRDFLTWSRPWTATNRPVASISGVVLHLWHGDRRHRRYLELNRELESMGFDPSVDLELTAAGSWRFASGRPDLVTWAQSYFQGRREDG
jgi:hypothetical protein